MTEFGQTADVYAPADFLDPFEIAVPEADDTVPDEEDEAITYCDRCYASGPRYWFEDGWASPDERLTLCTYEHEEGCFDA